jgi:uncharacterized cysteine cluster protein YcgN (CxxCxxCC family)|tara:strand:+ start:442 stop:708 length:267 start_codon:yes stop_codon:yes gene_type:complete
MIKLKDLIKEEHCECGGGCCSTKEQINEGNIKVIKSKKIDSRTWRQMKYDLRDQFDELVKVGEDYGVFQNAQGTHKMLKQIKRIMDKI